MYNTTLILLSLFSLLSLLSHKSLLSVTIVTTVHTVMCHYCNISHYCRNPNYVRPYDSIVRMTMKNLLENPHILKQMAHYCQMWRYERASQCELI